MITARRAARLAQITERIAEAGGQATALPVDVTDQTAVTTLAHTVVSEFGRLDVVVECAGVMPLSPLNALKLEDWERMIDVNIRGLLYSIRRPAAVSAAGRWAFRYLASTAALEVMPAAAVYSATKYAARAITEGLRLKANQALR